MIQLSKADDDNQNQQAKLYTSEKVVGRKFSGRDGLRPELANLKVVTTSQKLDMKALCDHIVYIPDL